MATISKPPYRIIENESTRGGPGIPIQLVIFTVSNFRRLAIFGFSWLIFSQ